MKVFLIGLASMTLMLAACTDRAERSLQKEAVATPNVSNVPAPVAGTADTLTNTAPAANNAVNGGSVALNPEHGQPGHRCDIPVGAPLNGAGQQTPANATTPTQGMQAGPRVQNSVPATTAPTQISSQVKLNPPHGEPGHDCAVPVGQPLPTK